MRAKKEKFLMKCLFVKDTTLSDDKLGIQTTKQVNSVNERKFAHFTKGVGMEDNFLNAET